ncbi:MAG: SMC-Scp complex subunit ScpB [Anaerolineales bacterium]|nr:SMC-Scp complex subunit ScpB [Anaerolineae bacterium]PWB50948.1 MAG: SMC-Scp complex subunit ScpB [Anaerolineales bacterium]
MSDKPTAQNTPDLIVARLEALLFVAAGAVLPAQLATALDLPLRVVENALDILEKQLASEISPRGFRLQRHLGRVQLTTAPDMADDVERFLGLESTSKLSRAALETLAIIAYQQPVTRPEIDAVRGVSSDGVLKSLLSKGLIQEVGRAERPGRPILYMTTADFLQNFGLNSLEELPPLSTELGTPPSSTEYLSEV